MKLLFGLFILTTITIANAQDLKKTFRIDFNTFNPQSDNNKCIYSSAGVGGSYSGLAAVTLTVFKNEKNIIFSQKNNEKLTTLSFKQDINGFQATAFGPCQEKIESVELPLLEGGMQLKVTCKTSSDQLIMETDGRGYLTRVALNLGENKQVEGLFSVQAEATIQSSCSSLNL